MSYLKDLQQSSANMFKPVNPMYLFFLSFVFVKINDFLFWTLSFIFPYVMILMHLKDSVRKKGCLWVCFCGGTNLSFSFILLLYGKCEILWNFLLIYGRTKSNQVATKVKINQLFGLSFPYEENDNMSVEFSVNYHSLLPFFWICKWNIHFLPPPPPPRKNIWDRFHPTEAHNFFAN